MQNTEMELATDGTQNAIDELRQYFTSKQNEYDAGEFKGLAYYLENLSILEITIKKLNDELKEVDNLRNTARNWEETAKQYCKNADYWRERAEKDTNNE
ncbi:MAG: hypothetical protein ABFC94_15695 [Syntrophomonas sp.]